MQLSRPLVGFLVVLVVLTGLLWANKTYRTYKTNGTNMSNTTAGFPTTNYQLLTSSPQLPNPTPTTSPQQSTTSFQLPTAFSLKNVPFTSQAPSKNWDAVHEEFCEEAVILVATEYFIGKYKDKIPIDYAESQLNDIKNWEMQKFGYFESTNINQTAQILTEKYNLKTEIIDNPTIEQIKIAIYSDKLVIAPAAGRLLKNPNFTGLGPIYHMLVISGWDKTGFITQDVGTRKGQNYHYSYETLLNAIHDLYDNAKLPLDEIKIINGDKKIIIISH
ncbi:MAG: Uncharacterized protein CEN91_361 [Candidatus Berkelbacteria bacterium Licking1014_85]|uniref:Peptidase C39-like domain-containing protein n=1 Tax=Candidatus Berkelbacteria bacterium Licking1014_85 TaxID=2017148 RepID=A0A554LJ07_9BACT|nr:MAG: Uncharacterized protein CEN91_361 [Candidatus Berkelbacteria bacterium Licking1014_85]